MFMGWKLTVVKMSVISKIIHRFNAIFTKTSTPFFADIEKPILKFIQSLKDPE